jgi:toxin-antitoxin system, toxin component, bro family|nr:MAG TPA: hypothetical protein [Caudoviricetes sp.]
MNNQETSVINSLGSDRFQIFRNDQLGSVRVQIDNQGNPWICLLDVCNILGLSNPAKVSSRLFSEGITLTYTLTNGGTQQLIFINEANLYKVIMASRKPEAEAFQRWVCFEVIPSIRKTGGYTLENINPFRLISKISEGVANNYEKIIEHGKQIAGLSIRVDTLEQELSLLNEIGYVTINGYCKMTKQAMSYEDIRKLGGIATKICQDRGIMLGNAESPEFGYIHMYPIFIIQEVFASHVVSN